MDIFRTAVSVVIPIYNAINNVKALVESLVESYPKPLTNLKFYIIDDCSTSVELTQWLDSADFFRRADVIFKRNTENLGFTKTVNRLISMTDPESDIVILNSDTLIFQKTFENLNKAAQRPYTASITPLSNKATIASIIDWPGGIGIQDKEQERETRDLVLRTSSVGFPALIDVPTGVGFCMYLTRTALNVVGLLNAEAFPRGYGEENDWCQRAVNHGFRNYIFTGEYVPHVSGASFQNESNQLIKDGMITLNRLHPQYEPAVHRFIESDPFKVHRTILSWQILFRKGKDQPRPFFLQVLHSDPTKTLGGTESYSRLIRDDVVSKMGCDQAIAYFTEHAFGLVFFPVDGLPRSWEFSRFENNIVMLWKTLLALVDCIHVQHTIFLPPIVFRMIAESKNIKKVISLHDYFHICPTIQLLNKQSQFCQIPENLDDCRSCLSKIPPYTGVEIGSYRKQNIQWITSFDHIITPSEASKRLIIKAVQYSPASDEEKNKFISKIQSIDNPYEFKSGFYKKRILAKNKGRYDVAFLGAISIAKGANLIEKAFPRLKKLGLSSVLIGKISANVDRAVDGVFEYDSPEALKNISEQVFPDVICLPALWPESFCYALYESLHFFDAPVVVGPYGHPAEVVTQDNLGVVMDDLTPEAMIKAIKMARLNKDLYSENIKKWRAQERGRQSQARDQLKQVLKMEIIKKDGHPKFEMDEANHFLPLVYFKPSIHKGSVFEATAPIRIIGKNWLQEVDTIEIGDNRFVVRDRGLDGQIDDITVGPLGDCRLFAWSIDTLTMSLPFKVVVFYNGNSFPADISFYNCRHAMEKVGKGSRKLLRCGIDIKFKIPNFWLKSECEIQVFSFFNRGVACELGRFEITGSEIVNTSRKLAYVTAEQFKKEDLSIVYVAPESDRKKVFNIETSPVRVVNIDELTINSGELFASGWAADLQTCERATVLLAFKKDRCVAAFPVQSARYHLANNGQTPELESSGFYGVQKGQEIAKGDSLTFFALWKNGVAIAPSNSSS
jgi:GT2 family glycosyltransferase/glycosyltransferase involved in cell wall biosynthesis